MSDATARLSLPFLAAAQAQKHVTHNEALVALDALIQLSALERRTVPPTAPAEGARYVVAADPAGAFSGHPHAIAVLEAGTWRFFAPQEGWICWLADEEAAIVFRAGGWSDLKTSSADRFGIAAAADDTNRLAVASPAVLFTHAGAGAQVKVNKAGAADTASLLFQTSFSGRAEFGLAGDDDWHVKVSSDGAAWNEALVADRESGAVRFPNGIEHAPTRKPAAQLLLTPGGDGEVSIYRNDAPRSQNPRMATVQSVAGDAITLTTPAADLFFSAVMAGVSHIRVWNLSRTPALPAWIRAAPATDRLDVTDAAHIAGWSVGDVIQLGDPADVTPGRVIALDISPMLQAVLGAVFRQSGILCKAGLAADTVGADLALSPSGIGGSFVTGVKNADTLHVWPGLALIPCTLPSPISNSNLVLVRETGGGILGTTLFSSIGVLA